MDRFSINVSATHIHIVDQDSDRHLVIDNIVDAEKIFTQLPDALTKFSKLWLKARMEKTK